MRSLKIFYWTILGAASAWLYLQRGHLKLVVIPPTQNQLFTLNETQTYKIVFKVERFVKRVFVRIFRTKHLCFYRSYILLSIFRRLGLPLALNIGMKNFHRPDEIGGHCWLTLNNEPFFEDELTAENFPVFMGTNNRGMAFWMQ
ncbi:MAG: hypothetical protein C0624_10750 [Desulfuromonas sp.]|nr:MAG: hypothetical protein C0624_10750 [Desulfuromonas sp.]